MLRQIAIVAAGAMLAASVFAQAPEVNQREKDQQNRVANGVRSGQLTAGETQQIEHNQAQIKRQIHNDRQTNGGALTSQQKTQVNQEDNRLSGRIYNDKHNSTKAVYGNNAIGQRRENQQDRIANGIASGQLKPGEAARREGQEQSVNRKIGAQREANGGTLTNTERQRDNARLNRQSRRVYRAKHNARAGY